MTISKWIDPIDWGTENRTVLAYHGTNVTRAHKILNECKFWQSKKEWDWIGSGIYFWEYAPHRAWEWSRKKFPSDPAVLSVNVTLGKCLDLTDTRFTSLLQLAYQDLKAHEPNLPRNVKSNRALDCRVLNYVVEELRKQRVIVDTVRAPFIEGKPIYEGALFYNQSHIQLCVRNDAKIDMSTVLYSHGH